MTTESAQRPDAESQRVALIANAVTSLQTGHVARALQIAGALVTTYPRDPFVQQLLGRSLKASGQYTAAAQAYRESLRLDPRQAHTQVSLGIVLRAAGDNRGAADAYRRAIEIEPKLVIAHHNLGNVLLSLGELEAARSSYEHAVAVDPNFADAHFELGKLASDRGDSDSVRAHFRAAATGRVSSAGAAAQIGRALSIWRERELACGVFAHASAMAPGDTDILAQYGRALYEWDDYDGAATIYRRVTELQPESADALASLGASLRGAARYDEAAACYERALALQPDTPAASLGLAVLDWDRRRFDAAEERLRGLLSDHPDYIEAWLMLTVVCRDANRFDAALDASARAFELDPERPQAHLNRGTLCLHTGDADGALKDFARACSLDPDWLDAAQIGLMPLNYASQADQVLITARHRAFGERFFARPASRTATHPGRRRLRIGYLSPDLFAHSVSYFLAPVLSHHDKAVFEVFCYDLRGAEDETAARLRRSADHWRVLRDEPDAAVRRSILADGLDVLIDCAGHTLGNRVRVVGARCARVQALWLGYPTTSGLPAIDYRITDAVVDPPGFDGFSTERLLRLPHSYYCYEPPADAPPVAAPPVLANGHLTFGSFNSLAKLSDTTIALWGGILQTLPQARLLLKAVQLRDETVRARTVARLAAHGLPVERVQLLGHVPGVAQHLELYASVDVALDTYPYNGATTTCEALWMGVPVITLAGPTHASRMGASILTAAGLGAWVAWSPAEFIEKCGLLAGRGDSLRELRVALRRRVAASPLMAAQAFTRDLEALLRMAADA